MSVLAHPPRLVGRAAVNLRELFDTPFLKSVRDAAATIRAFAFFAGLIGSAAVFAYLTIWKWALDPGLVVTAGIAFLIWIITVAAFIVYTGYYDPAQYELVEVEGTLLVEAVGDHHRYTYTKRQKVKALRGDVRVIEFKAHWTGQSSSGRPVVHSVFLDHVVLDGKHAEEDGRVHRWVYPGGPVGRGQTVDVGIRHVHEDDLATQRPYYRDGGGRYKAAKLTVTARFPAAEDPALMMGGVWNTHLPVGQNNLVVGNYPFERKVNQADNTVDYVVVARRPKRYHSYGLRWNWPSNSPQGKPGQRVV